MIRLHEGPLLLVIRLEPRELRLQRRRALRHIVPGPSCKRLRYAPSASTRFAVAAARACI